MYVYICSQITAASDWPRLFCTLGVLFSILNYHTVPSIRRHSLLFFILFSSARPVTSDYKSVSSRDTSHANCYRLTDPKEFSSMPRLKLVQSGIQRYTSQQHTNTVKIRLPITPTILQRI